MGKENEPRVPAGSPEGGQWTGGPLNIEKQAVAWGSYGHWRAERTHIMRSDVRPGDMLDGQRMGAPEYWRINHVRALEDQGHVWAHLAIDLGYAPARRQMACLHHRVRNLAQYIARHGLHLCLHLSRYDVTWHEVRVEAWLCTGDRIAHRVSLTTRGYWMVEDEPCTIHGPDRTDVLWRALVARADVAGAGERSQAL